LVVQIQAEIKTKDACFSSSGAVAAALENLRIVRDRMPTDERAHITETIKMIEKIRSDFIS
jgi:hypothetical protein